MASKKKKITTAIVAGVTALALVLGGTFAWQSINQTALNEDDDTVNPGGRLHDDLDGSNKDVYVENFADEDIFARIRLEEFFEITQAGGTVHSIAGSRIDEDTVEYVLHDFYNENATEAYWNWKTGGSTVFMPTFNKNKDSLVADVNGTYNGLDGIVTNEATDDRYSDYVEYYFGQTLSGNAIYDYDSNSADELGANLNDFASYPENVTAVTEEHTAKNTLTATLISMDEWVAQGSPCGNYWVYDTDGWVYWADAIKPGEATGLLLDGISLKDKMDDSWYYAINVIAQFVTVNDLGAEDGSGFYDESAGTPPTDAAIELLKQIGAITDEGDVDNPSYNYMWIYFTELNDTTHNAYYIRPDTEYRLYFEIDVDENFAYDYKKLTDVAPEFSLELTQLDGTNRELKEKTDYTITSMGKFEYLETEHGEKYLLPATIKFADSKVIPYASNIAVNTYVDNTFQGYGNYVVSDMSLSEENINIRFFEAETNEEVTKLDLKEGVYDIVVDINCNGTEYVVFSSDPTIKKPSDLEIVASNPKMVYCHWNDEDKNFDINDLGQLIVGKDVDPNVDWEMYNFNIYIDDLTVCFCAEDVIVKNADGSKTHYYVYCERDAYFEGELPMYIYINGNSSLTTVNATKDIRSFSVLVDAPNNDVELTDANCKFVIEGNNDPNTTVSYSEKEGFMLNLGADEASGRIVLVSRDMAETQKGAIVVDIIYE